MIKGKIVELVQERLNNGSTTSDIWKQAHPLVIQEYIGLGLDSIFYQLFGGANPTNGSRIEGLDVYGRWYEDQDIKLEGDRYYSDMPCSQVQLPDNSFSVRKITLTDDRYSVKFLPLRVMATSVLGRLGTTDRMQVTSYWVEGNKIYYDKHDKNITKVDIYAIPSFADLALNEDIPIPAGQGEVLINGLMKYFQKVQPHDKALNND